MLIRPTRAKSAALSTPKLRSQDLLISVMKSIPMMKAPYLYGYHPSQSLWRRYSVSDYRQEFGVSRKRQYASEGKGKSLRFGRV